MLYSENRVAFDAVSPMLEMGAYEWLWNQTNGPIKPSFKSLSDFLYSNQAQLFSDVVEREYAESSGLQVLERFKNKGLKSFGIQFKGTGDFPEKLMDAKYPIRLLYYRGDWDLIASPLRIAIVGSRHPTEEGIRRAEKLATLLTHKGFVIVSGLAKGIDTAAHKMAIEQGGRTIAVVGTPIDQVYPLENKALQEKIATEHLLVSQVPVLRYAACSFSINRFFFPERNITMSALTQATVIVEASNTSGSLIQARAALNQNRKLFILDNNFADPLITWPRKLEKIGAIRIQTIEEILFHLNVNTPTSQN